MFILIYKTCVLYFLTFGLFISTLFNFIDFIF